ncbi:hypothetical protein X943_002899 [Babesia divergens]|uniref:Uncharacterized protein n=1 Tax=Babesia divergens TaxID=32595 RepID=A0AAD9GIA2_BABDI|nr:hypothetical protein X943_002899 [Babesia divergens]
MAEFIDRAVNGAPNIAKLRNVLDSKIESIQEEAKLGYEIPSSIFLGEIYDEMLVAIAAQDVTTAQKWLIAISFVVKVERMRMEKGLQVVDNASQFFEGIISQVLDTLEIASPLIVGDMWRLLLDIFDFILVPSVAAVVKCHRRLANRAFKFILQTSNTEDTENVLLSILTWMSTTRTFDGEKADDTVYINQLQLLQNSKNHRISREATSLILSNLAKLCKKDKRAVPTFIGASVKRVTKELELGSTTKLQRLLELINVTFARCKSGHADAVVDLAPVWKMFQLLFERLPEYDTETANQALNLLPAVAKCLGPDIVLINISNIANIMETLFEHKVDLILGLAAAVETLLREMNDLCSDFYLVLNKQLNKLIDALNSSIDKAKWDDAAKAVAIITQMGGPSVGHVIEGLILKIASNDQMDWNDTELANSVVQLVHMHLNRGCSKHPKVLSILLAFLRQVRALRGHDRFMDNTIRAVSRMMCNGGGSDCHTDYTLYAQELQKYTETSAQSREPEADKEDVVMPEVKPSLQPVKTKQDEVVDAIRKKLKSMRQTSTA